MIRNRWAVLTILLGLASGASAQEPPRAKYGTHDVFLVLVQVKPTKIGKISWDPADGKPDLRVIISNEGSGKTFISDVAKDTYFVKFDLKDPILEVAEGDILEILVFDEDLTDHDMAGLSRKSLTSGVLAEEELDLTFGRVELLRLELRPRDGKARASTDPVSRP